MNHDIQRQARHWLTLLYSGKANEADRAQFEQWLNETPLHARAYRRTEQLWRDLQWAPELSTIQIDASSLTQRCRSWFQPLLSWPVAGAGLGAALLAAFLVLGPAQVRDLLDPRIKTYDTAIAQVREFTLQDGSHVALGARSKIRTHFSARQRRITLESGEALFTVAKDPMRPFSVAVGDTVVRAVGTQFDVRHGAEEIRVAVREGRVEVTPATGGNNDRRLLEAGQEVVAALKGGALTAVREGAASHAGSWREGRLSYENASLREVIADANRYSKRQIEFGTATLGAVRITTAFRTDQVDEMLASLAATHPIAIDRSHSGRIVLQPRAADGADGP